MSRCKKEYLLKSEIERLGGSNLRIQINPDLLELKGEVGNLARSFVSLIKKLRESTVY